MGRQSGRGRRGWRQRVGRLAQDWTPIRRQVDAGVRRGKRIVDAGRIVRLRWPGEVDAKIFSQHGEV